ncbi:DNA-processing protein DprA [Sphaerochaeta sp. PS]|uniref:DNA-processing protein DprA n=1 Tax=Sphaerochaeta sp. PS TaxID=3076336 RepID=UPI0028A3EB7B|nr:DNA-processing protein DprA [Sphaerochaeta sp. PS]MDT4761348.1 DNA-processing protein DprA [Sphaerochaeta sp. PS]
MDRTWHQALNYETLVKVANNSEAKALEAFSKALILLDTTEPFLLHLGEYASLLNIDQGLLSKAYYDCLPAFEAMDSSVQVLTWEHPLWPKQVNDFAYCPRFLYVQGNASLLCQPSIAVIGTRSPSLEGKKLASLSAMAIGNRSYVVASGLALGIDGIAHKSALDNGFPTFAVLGTPLNSCYPPEHALLQQEIAKRGALVSRFAPCSATQKWFFLLRNRLMSALSMASVVVEDRDGGGAVRQASFALEQKKYLFIYQSSVDNHSFLWPKQFANKPRVFVVKHATDIPRVLEKAVKTKEQVGKVTQKSVQLDLFSL